jgi:hypothetical protein
MADDVPNPYLATIRSHRTGALPVVGELRGDLDAAVAAMDAGAWLSSAADQFYDSLIQSRQTLATAADGVVATYDGAIRAQPERVEPHAWQTRWRNLR